MGNDRNIDGNQRPWDVKVMWFKSIMVMKWWTSLPIWSATSLCSPCLSHLLWFSSNQIWTAFTEYPRPDASYSLLSVNGVVLDYNPLHFFLVKLCIEDNFNCPRFSFSFTTGCWYLRSKYIPSWVRTSEFFFTTVNGQLEDRDEQLAEFYWRPPKSFLSPPKNKKYIYFWFWDRQIHTDQPI